jgi:peptide chain release factor 3
LLYGGAIQSAGSVKGKQTDKHAVSDWMDLEKQRGISITSSVMQFEYDGYCINILDTPGHQDFSEDTYRTLMAADSAVMVIDAAKGIEPQTRKLFKVCAMRHIPIFTFINKLDREARDPFDLLDELESEFGIGTYPMNWPIGCGIGFKGVYERDAHRILAFGDMHRGRDRLSAIECDINDTEKLDELKGSVEEFAKSGVGARWLNSIGVKLESTETEEEKPSLDEYKAAEAPAEEEEKEERPSLDDFRPAPPIEKKEEEE